MTLKENIKAILECYFTGFKDEIIESACNRILEQEQWEERLDEIRTKIEQKARPNELGGRGNGKSIRYGLCMALEIIDKYKAESEG